MATEAAPMSAIEGSTPVIAREVPVKLRCGSCAGLAVNAVRLPCCDSVLCEKCQSLVESSCPLCRHKPISAEDCKPHKNLRLTISAYLKSEERKREKERIRALNTSTELDLAGQAGEPVSARTISAVGTRVSEIAKEAPNGLIREGIAGSGMKDLMIASDSSVMAVDKEPIPPESGKEDQLNVNKSESRPQDQMLNHQAITQSGVQSMGVSQGAFNPMMQMQNGMTMGNWNQNIMGMNPMGMFGGYGMNEMNMMNMNMNMNMEMNYNNGQWGDGSQMQMFGDEFSSGNFQAAYGGYNQYHQNQNFGQRRPYGQFGRNNFHAQNRFQNQGQFQSGNFRQNSMTSRPGSSGQNSAGQLDNSGRGSKVGLEDSAGSRRNSNVDNELSNNSIEIVTGDEPPKNLDDAHSHAVNADDNMQSEVTSAKGDMNIDSAINRDEFNDHQGRSMAAINQQSNRMDMDTMTGTMEQDMASFHNGHYDQYNNSEQHQFGGDHMMNQMGFNQYNPQFNRGYGYSFRARGRGRFYRGFGMRGGFGRGYNNWQQNTPHFQSNAQVVTSGEDVGNPGVEGAPTGPKAMREGNRGRGGVHYNTSWSRGDSKVNSAHEQGMEQSNFNNLNDQQQEKRSAPQDNQRDDGNDWSEDDEYDEPDHKSSRAHSRSKRRHSTRQHSTSRSESPDEKSRRSDSYDRSHRHRRHKDEKSGHRSSKSKNYDDETDYEDSGRHTREGSTDSHRSRRHKSSRHRSDRDRDRDRKRSRSRSKTRRSKREERSKSRDREKDRDRHRDRKDRDRERDRGREKDRHSSRRDRNREDREREKDRHQRHTKSHPTQDDDMPVKEQTSTVEGQDPPQLDPHTLEREARNRERMKKEEERRRMLSGGMQTTSNVASDSRKRKSSRVELETYSNGYEDDTGYSSSKRRHRSERERDRERERHGESEREKGRTDS